MPLAVKDFSSGDKWDGGAIMVHGINNVGKTKFACAAAAHEAKEGRVYVLSFTQEMGYSSAAGMGLDKSELGYQALYEAASMDDWDEFMDLVEKNNKADGKKARCIVMDSVKAGYDSVQAKKTGGERPVKSGKSDDNEWPVCHLWMYNRMTRMRKLSDILIATCPSDMGVSLLKETETGMKGDTLVVPDLNGKLATGCSTWFNLIAYLMADSIKDGQKIKIKRTLACGYSQRYWTRQRMPGSGINQLIDIPEGNPVQGWITLKGLADKAYAEAYATSHKGK